MPKTVRTLALAALTATLFALGAPLAQAQAAPAVRISADGIGWDAAPTSPQGIGWDALPAPTSGPVAAPADGIGWD